MDIKIITHTVGGGSSFTKVDKRKKANGSADATEDSKKHFVMYYDYRAGALCSLVGGKAGSAIYSYLKWKKEMNGHKFYTIPNEHMFIKYDLIRQRISEGIAKLEAWGIVETKKHIGKSTRVKLRDLNIEFFKSAETKCRALKDEAKLKRAEAKLHGK